MISGRILKCSCLVEFDRKTIAVKGSDTPYQIWADMKILGRADIALRPIRNYDANDLALALRFTEVTAQEVSATRIVNSPVRERIDIAHAPVKMRLRATDNEGAVVCDC